MEGLNKTPLYEEHVKLGAKMVEFGGWEMPVFYSNVIEEHINTRTKAGLFDICHMGEFIIEGEDAFRLVQKIITNDLGKLRDGKALYSAICFDNGGVVDDLFVYRFSENKFMLVVNASNVEKDLKFIMEHQDSFDVNIVDKTSETAKIDLQGPNTKEILGKLTNADLKNLGRFCFVEDNVDNVSTIISRTGYTGEDGFELYFDSDKAVDIWNKFLEIGKEFGLKPVGLGARDTLRIESCYSLYGHELTPEINPFEAGIGFVVKLGKEEFIGRDSLLRLESELKRRIVAFEMLDRGIAREHYEIFKGSKNIGFVTSGTFSPTFKKPLGMAILDIKEAVVGNDIEVKIRDGLHKARIVERPIYKCQKLSTPV